MKKISLKKKNPLKLKILCFTIFLAWTFLAHFVVYFESKIPKKIIEIPSLNRLNYIFYLFTAMMYSDFHYRPPPPSYQASMQEYRLRLLLLDRQSGGSHPAGPTSGPGLAIEPPPNYRAHLR